MVGKGDTTMTRVRIMILGLTMTAAVATPQKRVDKKP